MTTSNSLKLAIGALALVIIALMLPTPLHNWFVDGSIGSMPADVVVITLLILVTPVTVISLVVAKFNVDFADEQP